eukprot:UN00280
MSDEARCNAVFNLLRRVPVQKTTTSLAAVSSVAVELIDDILPNVDEPLRSLTHPTVNKPFLVCDYNRDGDGYRFPGSKDYFIPSANGPAQKMQSDFYPSDFLLDLERGANSIFDIYRDQYFQGGQSSVYFFDTDENGGFGAAWLIHKDSAKSDAALKAGWWDSIHIFDVQKQGAGKYQYTLTSTVLISMNISETAKDNTDLSGSLTQQCSAVKTVNEQKPGEHIAIMGRLLEDQESIIRSRIESIYIGKTREVISVRTGASANQEKFAQLMLENAKQRENIGK